MADAVAVSAAGPSCFFGPAGLLTRLGMVNNSLFIEVQRQLLWYLAQPGKHDFRAVGN